MTNLHVVRGAGDLAVALADQSVCEARVVGYDVDKDIAVCAPGSRRRCQRIAASTPSPQAHN